MPKYHVPVLKDQVLQYLNNMQEGWIVDGTLGDGGHTKFILEHSKPGLRVLGIDQDSEALGRAAERLAPFRDRVTLVHGNFSDIKSILTRAGIEKIDGVVLDLGVSSRQLDDPARGFSFRGEGPLDMRMDPTRKTTAADLLRTLSDQELTSILKNYGEERYSRRIVRAIRKEQEERPVLTTVRLAEIVSGAIPSPRRFRIHPATRTFQALRIAVNSELEQLKTVLRDVLEVLNEGARILVISFHSLEDRIVKTFFRDEAKGCICPPKIPICICGKKATLQVITKRPKVPTEAEVRLNPRAASAKLRAAERVYV